VVWQRFVMDSANDSRFDPNFLAQLLVETAHERSVEDLLKKLVARMSERPDIRCVQIWLLDRRDQSLFLAGASEKLPVELADPSARIEMGVGLLGEIAARSTWVVLCDSDTDWPQVADPQKLKAANIRGFMGAPITHKGELLGITASYFDHHPPCQSHPWVKIFANHIGAAIAADHLIEIVSGQADCIDRTAVGGADAIGVWAV